MKHITNEDVILLSDGELKENEASSWREHAQDCGICRERIAAHERLVRVLAAPVRGLRDPEELIVLAMDRIERAEAPVVPSPSRRLRVLGAMTLGIAALAAGVALVARPRDEPTYVAARGGDARPSVARDVGVTVVRVVGATTHPLGTDALTSDSAYAVVTRNLGERAAYALVFAIDAGGAVHWLAPVFVDPDADPASIPVERSELDVLRGPGVAFERPASGALRFVAVVSDAPLRVSAVERLGRAELEPGGLRRRFPDADVRELGAVRIGASQENDR